MIPQEAALESRLSTVQGYSTLLHTQPFSPSSLAAGYSSAPVQSVSVTCSLTRQINQLQDHVAAAEIFFGNIKLRWKKKKIPILKFI